MLLDENTNGNADVWDERAVLIRITGRRTPEREGRR